MRTLGVDYGTVRIGLAVSDPTGLLAQGFSVLQRLNDVQAAKDIASITQREGVDEIVVGLPRNMNGTIGPRAEACQAFAERLRQHVAVPVAMYDERLTTVAAERTLMEGNVSRKRRKGVIDAVAATILLQSYLDWKRNQGNR